MVRRKPLRTRGKLQLSKYFQVLENGDSVAIVEERSVASSFPKRMQGRTGVVEGMKGKAAIVNIKDHNKMKQYLVAPVHLKKITNAQ